MLFNDNIDLIQKYTDEMLDYYKKYTLLEYLTTLKPVQEISDPLYLSKKIIIPKEILNGLAIGLFSNFIRSIQMGEFQYIIDQLRNYKINEFYSEEFPDRKMINNGINMLLKNTKPDFMIVPIEFFVDMHHWGMRFDLGYPPVLKYDETLPIYHYRDHMLKIMWSNKFINLKEIIIGNNSDSEWLYKPDKHTNERITIEFEREIGDDVLLTQTIFKYIPPYPECISIIRFDENLFKKNKNE